MDGGNHRQRQSRAREGGENAPLDTRIHVRYALTRKERASARALRATAVSVPPASAHRSLGALRLQIQRDRTKRAPTSSPSFARRRSSLLRATMRLLTYVDDVVWCV